METDLTAYPDTTTEARAKAEEAGRIVEIADDLTLQLDLDTAADVAVWDRARRNLTMLGIKPVSIRKWASKSGNTHIQILLADPLPIIHRIGLQAALGSDRRRELLAFRDVVAGYEFPVMLFRPCGALIEAIEP